MQLAWLTDIHLNFIGEAEFGPFCRKVVAESPDAVLIGGDIGEAHNVLNYLRRLDSSLGLPIFFVLGNHDFYEGSVREVRARVDNLCRGSTGLRWLNRSGVIPLSRTTCLVGHDSWADGRYGDFENSTLFVNDFHRIRDLILPDAASRLQAIRRLAEGAAAHFREVLPEALSGFRKVLVLTHAPPFREVCRYRGHSSEDQSLPHYSCKIVGDILREAMRSYPDREMTVLCGHTHSRASARILPNLLALAGSATYGKPEVQRIIEVR